MPRYHLAQLNVAIMREPLDSPAMREFADLLDPVNALADDAPGFVWRHRPDGGRAEVRPDGATDALIVNLSVWRDVAALTDYVYSGPHLAVMRRRSEWLRRADDVTVVLWWIPTAQRPTVEDGFARLGLLRSAGPTPAAFTFKTLFDPPRHDPPDVANTSHSRERVS